MRVFVINRRGKPLMPCSPAKARVLLREKKAKVRQRTPFTIQLTIATGESKQNITLGQDAGYRHVGLSATTEKAELFASETELRHDIPDLLATRLAMRHNRRQRKTRYRAPRFNNRVHNRKKGWLAPSVEHRIDSHIRLIENVCRLLPVTKIMVETASFDIQAIRNPDISGLQYQQGEQLGFWNVREYVLWRDGHKCQHCKGKSKDPILNVHHLESRKTGGDSPNNLVTLCGTCHKAYHAGQIDLNFKRRRSMRSEASMGIMRWALFNRLKEIHLDKTVKSTYGFFTKYTRIKHGIEKTHCADAFCITGNLNAKRLPDYLLQKQVRKHNRQTHKMTIGKGGVRKRQQAPYQVFGFRLFDKVRLGNREGFIFGRRSKGCFDIRKITGERITEVTYRKLKLVEPRKSFLIVVCPLDSL
ncbi:MAG: RNA-guided endonuclease IscB [Sutterellaceae bacterium]|nr:RNA-guided endonuclease IscB [Sutterellaceae bacterium]